MVIDLRSLSNKGISKGKEKINSKVNDKKFLVTNVSEDKLSKLRDDYPSDLKQKSDIISNKNSNNKLSKAQWLLLCYTTIFLAILSSIVFINWDNTWQLPKTILFIFGVSGFLIISSTLWIFGYIKHIVRITLGDIILAVLGFGIVIVSFLNPNQISFWGSISRMFDAGIFIGFLTLFYILLKIFLDKKTFNILLLFFAFISLIGLLVGALAIYIPSFNSVLSILSKLQITGTWLTEYPKDLVLISLLSFNIIFVFFFQNKSKAILSKALLGLYYIALFVHIILLIRLPDYSMYVLTVIALLINTIFYINKLFKNNISKGLAVTRISFIYGSIVILLISLAIIRPFKNNTQFPEYTDLTVPNINTTLSIARQSLQSDTLWGSGDIVYAWNKFNPSFNETQISNFSFETLYSEIANIVVRYGLIVSILIGIFAIWVIGTLLRLLFIHKNIPVETYTLLLAIIGLFLMPFTVITKVLFILILVWWSNIVSKYFNPIIKLNLDINKIPASISSLCTFIILFCIATTVFTSTKLYNIFQSQEYVIKASQLQNNLIEQVDLLKQAQDKSPYILDYAQLHIPSLIKQINQEAFDLSNTSKELETQNIDAEKQSNLQLKIASTQSMIDGYREKFPSDARVLYWQLDLYLIIHRYGVVDENEYMVFISKGRDLQKNSLYWDIYEAQYYAIKAQRERELNLEQFNKAKNILNKLFEKDNASIEVYRNYYELLTLNKDYKGQIDILSKYIDLSIKNNLIADSDLVYLLGVAYQNNKQYNEAIDVYNKILESFPNYTNVYFKFGEIYESQKKNELAIQQYEKVLELDPNAELARTKLEQLK